MKLSIYALSFSLLVVASSSGQTQLQNALYGVNMRVQSLTYDNTGGFRSTWTDRQILQELYGVQDSRQYAMVYNAGRDAIQIANRSTGEIVQDVLFFEGGTWTANETQSRRLTFVFTPGSVDAVGTAILDERSKPLLDQAPARVNVNGTMQLAITGNSFAGLDLWNQTGSVSSPESRVFVTTGLLGNGPTANTRVINVVFSFNRLIPAGTTAGNNNNRGSGRQGTATNQTGRFPVVIGGPNLVPASQFGVSDQDPYRAFGTSPSVSGAVGSSTSVKGSVGSIGSTTIGVGQPVTSVGQPTIGIGQQSNSGTGFFRTP